MPFSDCLLINAMQLRHRILVLPVMAAFLIIPGCTQPPNNAEVRKDAQQTTEQVKQDTKEAAQQTKVALANAEQTVDAAAQGVRDGLHSNTAPTNGKSLAGKIDLNSASRAQLQTLPGVTVYKAKNIEAARPLTTSHDLVDKRIMSEAQYQRIANSVTVN